MRTPGNEAHPSRLIHLTAYTPDGLIEFWHQSAAVELSLFSYDTLTRNVRIGESPTIRDILALRDEQDSRVSLERVGFRRH